MAAQGIACHAIDLRGQGRSSGRRGFVARWDEYLDDVDQLLASLHSQEKLPLFVLGHSHGGLVVASGAIRERSGFKEVAGCILTSPFFKCRFSIPKWKILAARAVRPLVPWMPFASNVSNEWLSSDPQMVEQTTRDPLCVRVATPSWYVGHLAAQRQVMQRANDFKLPLLMLTAGADPIADPAAEKEFFDACGSGDKQFKLYENCRHELLREVCREKVFDKIYQWIGMRLSPSPGYSGGGLGWGLRQTGHIDKPPP
jgi:alpha-beta hydrolase superfamily lysophospholipase